MRYLFTNTFNTRDLGGYPINLTAHTLYKRILRSDALLSLSEDEIKFLLGINVTTIIDLRSTFEINRNPCFLKDIEGFNYKHCQMYGFEQLPQKEEDVAALYYKNLESSNAIFDVMKILADAKSGVLFHCSAGKDRTGIISALLLSLVGVPKNDILVDYQISYTYILEMVKQLHMDNPDLPSFIGQSKIEYIDDFLQHFNKKYGSVENYFLEIGLTKKEIQAIKSKLTEY